MVAVDWGSSQFRAYLLAEDGGVLEAVCRGKGVLARRAGDYERIFHQTCGGWLRRISGIPVLMAGMVGSRDGWLETEYVPCPVGLGGLGGRIVQMPIAGGRSLHVVPGISNVGPSGLPDVIRGEETQMFGVLGGQEGDGLLACFPGTHSKWAWVERSRIVNFSTFMTGELFAVLSRCASLAPFLTGRNGDGMDEAAFLEGVSLSRRAGGLSHQAFSIRSEPLVGRRPSDAGLSRLSGLLIGTEVEAGLRLYPGVREITVVGAEELGLCYGLAFAEHGVVTRPIDGRQAFASGAWRLAAAGGLRSAP